MKMNIGGKTIEFDFLDIEVVSRQQETDLIDRSLIDARTKEATSNFPELTEEEAAALVGSGFELRRIIPDAIRYAQELGEYVLRFDGEVGIMTRRISVRMRSDISETTCKEILSNQNLKILNHLRIKKNLFVVIAPLGVNTHVAASQLRDDHGDVVLYADPVIKRQFVRRFNPHTNPPLAGQQWQWPKISAAGAWATTRGSGISVAVIDRGFRPRHELFVGRVNQNLSAWFNEGGEKSHVLEAMPNFNHGIFCSAQVAAKSINPGDVTGIAPETELILVSTPGKSELFLSQLDLAIAVVYAASPSIIDSSMPDKGADIITCAEGPKSGKGFLDGVLKDAFDFVTKSEVPLFWAVANVDIPISADDMLSHPGLIRIGSSTFKNEVAPQCAFGEELDFLAPGHNVFNLYGNKPYHQSGTSFAAPTAAGVAALIFGAGGKLPAETLRKLMRLACDKVKKMNHEDRTDAYGSGVINAKTAVEYAKLLQAGDLIV